MPAPSIEAECRRCHEPYFLDELLLLRSGACPRCGWRLTEDWVGALLESMPRAESSQRQLVHALRRMQGSQGSSADPVPVPHEVVRALVDDIGWQAELVRAAGLHVADATTTRPVPPWTNGATQPMTIIVRTDGSDHSARAVGPAHRLARLAGGTVLEHAGGASSAGIEVHDRSTDSTDSTVCVATRRIGRSGVLRCVNEVGAPTLCIGPRVQEPPWHPRRGLLVCLDGTPESERALAPARRWAALLGEPITLLTVTAERRPAVDGAGHRFHFGPLDPAAYLGGLADELRADGATVSTVVLTDPLSAASALRRHLRLDRSSLVVTSTSSRTNLRAVLLRSVAATIVDTSRVPVLVVPSITNPALT